MVRWPHPGKGSIWLLDRHWDGKAIDAEQFAQMASAPASLAGVADLRAQLGDPTRVIRGRVYEDADFAGDNLAAVDRQARYDVPYGVPVRVGRRSMAWEAR